MYSYFAEILEAAAKLPSKIKTSEDPIDPLFQVVISLSTDTVKDTFHYIDGNIGEFSGKKETNGSDRNCAKVGAEHPWKRYVCFRKKRYLLTLWSGA